MLLMMSSVILYGCDNGAKGTKIPLPPLPPHSDDVKDIDVYVDGTFSMAGYVNCEGKSVYMTALENIERANSKGKIQFIRFGDEYKKLSRDEFLKSNRVEFYDQKDTSIQDVINRMSDNKLTIIVTDLFQTNQDLYSLTNALKNKVFSNPSKAFAIVGMRSQFNGTIYDIGKNKKSFSYDSGNNTNAFRPFYFLVSGEENVVRNYLNSFRKTHDSKDDFKEIMFSKNLGSNNVLAVGKNDNKGEKAKPMAKITLSKDLNDAGYLQCRLHLDEKVSKMPLVMKSSDIITAPDTDYKLKIESVEKLSVDKKAKEGTFSEIKTAKSFIRENVKHITMDEKNGEIVLDTFFVPSAINLKTSEKEGIYRVKFAMLSDRSSYLNHNKKIFDEWNFTENDVVKGNNLKTVGCKTLNISRFVDDISSYNLEENKPGFYNLYLYFEAK